MTSNAHRSARAEIVVVDSRPLFGYGVAAAFDPAGVRALAVPPEAIEDLPESVRVALVALVVPAIATVVGGLVRRPCRVIVYGAADGSTLSAATRAGATGFVSDQSGAIGMRLAVDAIWRGAGAFFPDDLDHGNRLRSDRLEFAALTPREREVLDALVAGMRPADIAARDFVSVVTVRNQVQSVLTKLNVHSQLEAVAFAHLWGWSLEAA